MKSGPENLERDNMSDGTSNQNGINIAKLDLTTDAGINLASRPVQETERDNMNHDIDN
jgi:hypothetical protein